MIAKTLLLSFLVVLVVVLGSIPAAWRRACVQMTRKSFGVVSNDLVLSMTPPFAAKRHGWTLLLWLVTSVLALVLFGWKVALSVLVGTYGLMELAGFLFPKPDSMYYVHQTIRDLEVWIRLYTRRGEGEKAQDARRHLEVLRSAYRLQSEAVEGAATAAV